MGNAADTTRHRLNGLMKNTILRISDAFSSIFTLHLSPEIVIIFFIQFGLHLWIKKGMTTCLMQQSTSKEGND